jgi:glycogen(starch) synthase
MAPVALLAFAARPPGGPSLRERTCAMRVALLPSDFWPAVGGVEELTRRLAEALIEAGDSVEIWAPLDRRRPLAPRETWCGLEVRRFPMPLPPRALGPVARMAPGMARGLRQLRKAVADYKPDVLHVQCFGPNGAYATAVSQLTGVPLVITLQGETVMDDHDIFERSALMRAALRWGFRRAAAVTACSAFTLADARRFGLAEGAGKVVYNGVRLDEGDGAGGDDGGDLPAVPFGRYVLALGRVVEKKGFDLLLLAFAKLERGPELGLVIGGEGDALGSLRQLAGELGISESVYFPGRLGRSAVGHLMRAADVFVMPSRLEPFGIVVLEAWREGTAVIATTRGGPAEFVRGGVDGLLVDPSDTDALAAAIGGLLDDASRRASLAEKGHQKAQGFSWRVIAHEYREIYAQVAGCDLERAVHGPSC